MAFPFDPLPIRTEMLIDGTWTDITERVRGVSGGGIVIDRGYRNESGSTFSPATARFDLNNRDAFFSTKAPLSANYGKLPPGTQVRISVDDPDGMALELVNDYDDARSVATTADKAVLDITSDIEIRADLKLPSWTSADSDTGGVTIVSKWQPTGSQRSWGLTLTHEGELGFLWTTGGVTSLTHGSTAAVPFAPGERGAVRVLFDADNGASGRTSTFYTGPTINGPWTQLGSPVTTATATSIFSSTASVVVGALESNRFAGTRQALHGRVYRVQIYSGLTGTTLRADPNFAGQTAGDDSFSDGLGTPNTWTVPTEIGGLTTGTYRFWGEVAELPQRWDSTGTDIFVPTQAADLMRGLTQGESARDSALFRYLSTRADLLSYFPLEEETGATRLSNLAPLGEKGRFNDVTFGADGELPASKSVLTFNSATSYATSYGQRRGKGVQDYATFVFHFKLPAVPVSEIQLVSLGFTANGGYRYTLNLTATTWVVRMFSGAGTALDTATVAYGTFMSPDRWTAVRFQTHELGTGFIEMELAWIDIENQVIAGTTAQFGMDPMGMQSTWNFAANAALDGLKLAHVFMGQAPLEMTSQFLQAATAYASERAGNRLLRMADEAGLDIYLIGDPENTERMGGQPPETFSKSIEDCAAVDGGLLYSRRDTLALGYRTQKSLLNADAVELSYSAGQLSNELLPTDDDQILRNDVTISRPGGGQARATKETGPRSIADTGRRATSYGLPVYTDERLLPLAEYAVALGTWDELRYPVVEVEQSRNAFVADPSLSWALRTLDVGDVLKLTGLPAWLPPDDVELAFRGVTETLRNRQWSFRWNTQAYGPYRAVNLVDSLPEGEYNLASAAVSVLEASATDTATSFTVNSPGPVALWRTGAVNRAIRLGGELATVGTIADSVTDSFTRSVASGWGSTDTGQAWTNAGGTAANFNVAAGVGTISLATINASRRLTLPTTYGDSTSLARFTISVNPTGDDVETTLMGRYQDGSNYMQASIFWDGDATFADLQIVRRLAGVATTLAVRRAPFTQASSSLTAWLMFQCHGTAYRMKAWTGTRAQAPTRWLLSGTDSSFSSGLNGIRGNIQPSFSGSTPVTVTVEDYAVADPQTFSSITRSQNGIVKAHDALTVIDLAKPFYAGKGVGP